MNNPAIELFTTAANTAEQALQHLNTASTPCECCGLNKATNWDEQQIASQAVAAVQKLRKLAGWLERKSVKSDS